MESGHHIDNQFELIGNKISDFEQLEILGQGNYGLVNKMKSRINDKIYAVKSIPIPKNERENIQALREQYIMCCLSHPNIVALYKTFQDGNNLYFVSEFIEGRNLKSYIEDFKKDNPNGHINQDLVIKIFKQILIGLNHLHNNGIIHRDIKPENILIDIFNNIKIVDFGLSAICKEGFGFFTSKGTRVGDAEFICPEIIKGQKYNYKCDIFNLGYTMYYVMNFCLPSISFLLQNENVLRYELKEKENNYDIKLVELIRRMYSYNPSDRPDTSQALQELNLIEKNNINDSLNDAIDKKDFSSMDCVLQCLYSIDDILKAKKKVMDELREKYVNKTFFPLLFFDILDTIDEKRKNAIDTIKYKKNIINLFNQLSQKDNSIRGTKPSALYYKILSLFEKEFNSLIEWNNKMLSFNYICPVDFPQKTYPDIYKTINYFIMNYRNPLVDIFYFIIIVSERCPNCRYILEAYSLIASHLFLNNKNQNNIMQLIDDYFGNNYLDKNVQCICGYCGKKIKEALLYNAPDYLILDLDVGESIDFNNQIDLTKFVVADLGQKKYELFAVINEPKDYNSNPQYVCSIKEKGIWSFYSGDKFETCGNECLKMGIPSFAIYKKI